MSYYIDKGCPTCKQASQIIFYRCDTGKIVLMCDECDLVWPDPIHVTEDTAVWTDTSDGMISILGCSVYNNARAAKYEEIPPEWQEYVMNPPHSVPKP